LLFLAVCCAAATWLDGRLGVRGQWGLGCLFGAFFLARVDGFFLLAGLFGLKLARSGLGTRRELLRVAVPTAAIGLAYLAGNLLLHGRVMPISGALKSMWSGAPRPGEWEWWLHGLGRLFWYFEPKWFESALGFARALVVWPLLWLVALALLPVQLRRRSRQLDPGLALLWACVAALLPKHMYYALLQGAYNDGYWYYTTEYLTTWLLLAVHTARAVRAQGSTVVRCFDSGLALLLAAVLLWANLPRSDELLAVPHSMTGPLLMALTGAIAALALGLRYVRDDRERWGAGLIGFAFPVALLLTALPARAITLRQPIYSTVKSEFADLGRWMRDVGLARHGTVGAYSAGVIGYWAGGNVTNLDGLVGDWEWFELSRKHGMVPPPRREMFVADYYPPLRQQLIEAGYVPILDELPRYRDGVAPGDEVWVVAADRAAAARMYEAVLRDPTVVRAVRVHAAQAVLRHELSEAAQSLRPMGVVQFADSGDGALRAAIHELPGEVLVAELGPEHATESFRLEVDGAPIESWNGGVHAIDLLPWRGRRVEAVTVNPAIHLRLLDLP
jgi:hypothetical protein